MAEGAALHAARSAGGGGVDTGSLLRAAGHRTHELLPAPRCPEHVWRQQRRPISNRRGGGARRLPPAQKSTSAADAAVPCAPVHRREDLPNAPSACKAAAHLAWLDSLLVDDAAGGISFTGAHASPVNAASRQAGIARAGVRHSGCCHCVSGICSPLCGHIRRACLRAGMAVASRRRQKAAARLGPSPPPPACPSGGRPAAGGGGGTRGPAQRASGRSHAASTAPWRLRPHPHTLRQAAQRHRQQQYGGRSPSGQQGVLRRL